MRAFAFTLLLTATLPAWAPALAAAPSDAGVNVTAAPVDAATHRAEVDAWHTKRLERLRAEDGWLALVGLHWLDEGDNATGSAKDAKVKLPAAAPARLGTYSRKGFEVRFTPADGAPVTLEGEPFPGGPVKTDEAGKPDVLRHGSLQLLAIKRGDRVGIRVRDAEAPLRKSFTGIARFDVSPRWRKDARWEAAKPGETVAVPNILGAVETLPLAGTAVFTHDGKEYRLVATQEGDSLFFVYGDLTNRKDTYGAGRFLYTDLPKEGRVVLDFNRGYNPPCAFSAYATCPLPPKQNKLALRIEAGERRYGDH